MVAKYMCEVCRQCYAADSNAIECEVRCNRRQIIYKRLVLIGNKYHWTDSRRKMLNELQSLSVSEFQAVADAFIIRAEQEVTNGQG